MTIWIIGSSMFIRRLQWQSTMPSEVQTLGTMTDMHHWWTQIRAKLEFGASRIKRWSEDLRFVRWDWNRKGSQSKQNKLLSKSLEKIPQIWDAPIQVVVLHFILSGSRFPMDSPMLDNIFCFKFNCLRQLWATTRNNLLRSLHSVSVNCSGCLPALISIHSFKLYNLSL